MTTLGKQQHHSNTMTQTLSQPWGNNNITIILYDTNIMTAFGKQQHYCNTIWHKDYHNLGEQQHHYNTMTQRLSQPWWNNNITVILYDTNIMTPLGKQQHHYNTIWHKHYHNLGEQHHYNIMWHKHYHNLGNNITVILYDTNIITTLGKHQQWLAQLIMMSLTITK